MQVVLVEAVSSLIGTDAVDLANFDVTAHYKEPFNSNELCCKCN
jgi:hypothetical protein